MARTEGTLHAIRKTLLAIAACGAGLSFAAGPEAPVEVVGAEFGIFRADTPGELVFEPTAVVPHQVGQRYGWIIEVRSARRSLAVREEYLLPTPAREQESASPAGKTLTIPLDRRNQVSQRQLVPRDGKIYGEWAIGPNEPAGHRQLQVVIEGRVAATFEYEVK